MAKLSIEEIVSSLKEMTMLEINDLVKAVETEFGVTAAAPVAVAAAAPAEEETSSKGPSEVSVFLKNAGQTKVAVIKVVQAITGLGLLDAKKLVDGCGENPVAVKEHIALAEADDIKAKLIDAGAEVEVK